MTNETQAPVMAAQGWSPSTSTIVKVAVTVAVLYSVLSRGMMSVCSGGYDADGFVDGLGNPTTLAPLCLSVSFLPNPYVYLLIAAITIAAYYLIRAGTARPRTVVTAAVVALIAAGSIGTALQFAPLHQGIVTEWTENRTFTPPPFANVVVEIYPATDQAG